MAIDISTVQYEVDLIVESGTIYRLDDALTSLQWEEQPEELAQRATIKVANMLVGNTYLISLAKLGCIIRIYGRWNGGARTILLEGTIWEWQYTSTDNKELQVTVYDPIIRLQQSRDFKYYSAGQDTKTILGDICKSWGIPLDYQWEKTITHEKKLWSATAISDMVIELLDEVKQQTGTPYVLYYRDGALQVAGYGTNATVYKFQHDRVSGNTVSTLSKLSMTTLVTRVKVLGTADDDGRCSVDALVDGDTSYGVLQEVVQRTSNKTLAEAQAEAKTILAERGKPTESIMATVPDLPFLRKGDKVEMAAGNLLGFFYTKGVAHNGTTKTMVLTLVRA